MVCLLCPLRLLFGGAEEAEGALGLVHLPHNTIAPNMDGVDGVSELPNGGMLQHQEPESPSRLKAGMRNVKLSFLHSISRLYGTSATRSLKLPGEQPQVMVGPVIGKVTSTTARILIEIDKTGGLTIELKESAKESALEKQPSLLQRKLSKKYSSRTGHSSHGDKKKLQKNVIENRPSIFEFKDLKPETHYTVEVKNCTIMTKSGFRTFPEVPAESLSFGVISCNKIFITDIMIAPAWDLWAHLSKNIEAGKVDLLLHLGDQVRPLLLLTHHTCHFWTLNGLFIYLFIYLFSSSLIREVQSMFLGHGCKNSVNDQAVYWVLVI